MITLGVFLILVLGMLIGLWLLVIGLIGFAQNVLLKDDSEPIDYGSYYD